MGTIIKGYPLRPAAEQTIHIPVGARFLELSGKVAPIAIFSYESGQSGTLEAHVFRLEQDGETVAEGFDYRGYFVLESGLGSLVVVSRNTGVVGAAPSDEWRKIAISS